MVKPEFKAEKDKDGKIVVYAQKEKKGNDVIMHVPSFSLIKTLKTKFKE